MNLNEYMDKGIGEKNEGLKDLCCGCGACEQICPTQAIHLKINEEGFAYPVIEEKLCVNCGICVKKCQCIKEISVIKCAEEPRVYAAVNNDPQNLKRSSSGGVAFLLGKYIIEQKGVVFGAAYDEEMNIVHKKVETEDELWRLQGSKYAQSIIGRTYRETEESLKQGKKVLFMGTPCQIGGLYHFLGQNYPQLYTMDVICYGVPSSGIYKDYIKWKEKKAKGKIKNINFRSKIIGWGDSVTEIEFLNKRTRRCGSDEDEWYQTFISHVATRESCHHCKYTNFQRMSDITVGDFWGIEKYKPDMDCKAGISKILVNTNKGRELFDGIVPYIWYEEMDAEAAIRPNLQHPPKRSDKRKQFFEDYKAEGFYKAFMKNVRKPIPFKIYIKRRLKIAIKNKVVRK